MKELAAKHLANIIKFDFGEEVEFAIKAGKDTGVVCDMILRSGGILYGVVWSDKSYKQHYEFELRAKEA